MRKQIAVVAAIAAGVTVSSTQASIVGGTVTGESGVIDAGGTFVFLTPGIFFPSNPANTVGDNNFQTPNLYGFDEDQNIILPGDIDVDIGPSGGLAAGTVVASHYVFFDPASTSTLTGTVTFDSDVLAILTRTSTMAATDFLANTGVNYLNDGLRGLEGGDSVSISASDPRTIEIDFTAGSPGDYIRVLTAESPVPEPNSIAAAFACGGLLLRRRR